MNRLFVDDQDHEAFQAAEQARQRADWDDFLAIALSLLRRRLSTGNGLFPGDLILIERLADVAVLKGEYEAADDFLSAIVIKCKETDRLFAVDYALLKRAHAAAQKEDFGKVLDILRSLDPEIGPLTDVPFETSKLPAWENACRWASRAESQFDADLLLSRFYLSAGLFLASEGQYGHAAVLLDRGATHAQPPASNIACRAWVPLRLATAGVLIEQGQLGACSEVVDRLTEVIEPFENPGWHVRHLELTGRLCLLRGDFGRALNSLDEVSQSCRSGRFAAAALGALINQADVLIILNQITVAEELLREAADLSRALNDDEALIRISWLEHLAHLRTRSVTESVSIAPTVTEMQRGKEPATQVISDDREVSPLTLPPPANFFALFEQKALGIQWALSRGDITLADELLSESRLTFNNVESPLIQLRLHALAGMVAYEGGDFAAAARIFEELQPLFEEYGLKPDLWQALRFRVWCAARLNAAEEEIQRLSANMRKILDELAGSLPAAQRAIYLLNKWTAEENVLRVEIEQLAKLKAELAVARWFKRPWLRWKLWRQLKEFLHHVDKNRSALAQTELTITARDSGAAVPTLRWLFWRSFRSASISFLVLPDRVFTVTIGWMKLDFAVAPVTRLRIRQLVAGWHRAALRGMGNNLLTDQLAGELDLTAVIHSLPRRVKKISFVADDSLHGFPFAALRYDGDWLLKRFAISMSYDRVGRPVERPQTIRGSEEPLLVAVARGGPGISQLGGTVPEIRQTEKWLQARGLKACTLIDDEASREEVLTQLAKAPFLHVACHGSFEPDRPDASGLVMIPQPDRVELISVRDLSELDLCNLQHVTLSSCWGADSFVLPGRWIVSLPETLCRRGADSVISCLWPIDDEVGKAFASRLNHYFGELSRDEALRATQLDCINNQLLAESNRKTEDPFYWAGYRLHGKTSRITF